MRYNFPVQAKFNKAVPKNKIYEKALVNTALKEKFVSQIEKIVWSYKLAEETLKIPATPKIPEIEVFDVYLKSNSVDEALIKAIDKAIPLPIFFYIHSKDGRLKAKAAYKRPSEADSHKWVIESYFENEWFGPDEPTLPLPVALDLEKLYAQMIKALMPQEVVQTARTDDIEAEVERARLIQTKERAYQQLKTKRDREKQFNKKVKLNEQLHALKEEIEMLKYADNEER